MGSHRLPPASRRLPPAESTRHRHDTTYSLPHSWHCGTSHRTVGLCMILFPIINGATCLPHFRSEHRLFRRRKDEGLVTAVLVALAAQGAGARAMYVRAAREADCRIHALAPVSPSGRTRTTCTASRHPAGCSGTTTAIVENPYARFRTCLNPAAPHNSNIRQDAAHSLTGRMWGGSLPEHALLVSCLFPYVVESSYHEQNTGRIYNMILFHLTNSVARLSHF